MKNVDILFEDDFILIINKPAGLAVQGGEGIKTSLDKLLAEIRTPPPLLVHRLDKDTSGVLLVAKGREAAARFSRIINSKSTIKTYIAICSGCPDKKEGVIREDILVHGKLKKSETKYRVIKSGGRGTDSGTTLAQNEYSVLEIQLSTGRMHQIRRHLAMQGNPILGDDKYGDFALNKNLRKTAGIKRLLLHAFKLIIKDEVSLEISAPLPECFGEFV